VTRGLGCRVLGVGEEFSLEQKGYSADEMYEWKILQEY
jgi:hypothetical protein